MRVKPATPHHHTSLPAPRRSPPAASVFLFWLKPNFSFEGGIQIIEASFSRSFLRAISFGSIACR